MDREFIETSIKSYETRLREANERAVGAIGRAEYWVAMVAITDAAGYKACIEELEFQLECMEVE